MEKIKKGPHIKDVGLERLQIRVCEILWW